MSQLILKYWPVLVFIIPTLVAIGIKFGSYTTKLNLVKEFGERIDRNQASDIADTKKILYEVQKEITNSVSNQIKLVTDLLMSSQNELSTQIKDISSRIEATNLRVQELDRTYKDEIYKLNQALEVIKDNIKRYEILSKTNSKSIIDFVRALRQKMEKSLDERSEKLDRIIDSYNNF